MIAHSESHHSLDISVTLQQSNGIQWDTPGGIGEGIGGGAGENSNKWYSTVMLGRYEHASHEYCCTSTRTWTIYSD